MYSSRSGGSFAEGTRGPFHSYRRAESTHTAASRGAGTMVDFGCSLYCYSFLTKIGSKSKTKTSTTKCESWGDFRRKRKVWNSHRRELGESGNTAWLLNSLRIPLTIRSTGLSTKSQASIRKQEEGKELWAYEREWLHRLTMECNLSEGSKVMREVKDSEKSIGSAGPKDCWNQGIMGSELER